MRDLPYIDVGGEGASEQASSNRARTEMSALLREVILAEAAGLARAGRHAKALELLGSLSGGAGLSAAGFDLLARIHAQRGELAKAGEAWERALEGDPGNRDYEAGLSRINRLLSRSPSGRFVLRLIAFVVVIAILATAVYLAIAAIGGELAALREETVRLSALTEELGERQPPPLPAAVDQAVVQTAAVPDVRIDLAGVSTRTDGDCVRIEFEEGLFERATTLTPAAAGLLARLGGILENYIDEASIEIIGHTDDISPLPGSRFEDNYRLAVARAVAVAEHISSNAQISLSLLAIRGRADFSAPFPNDSEENRLRNRTAVIRISAKR